MPSRRAAQSVHKPRLRSSLRLKLLIASVAVEMVMLALLVANGTRLIHDHLIRTTQTRVEELRSAFSVALVGPMAARDVATLHSILEEWLKSESISYMVVTDNRGRVVVASGRDPALALPLPDAVPDAADPVFDSVVPLGYAGQSFGVLHFGLSTGFIVQARHALVGQSSAIALTEILLSVLLLAGLGYWLTRHLWALTLASAAMAAGRLDTRVNIPGGDEVGVLADSFNSMAAAVESRMAELDDSRRQFRAIADHTYAWENWFDPSGRLAWINPAVERITGYGPDECRTMPEFPLPLVFPDDRALVRARHEDALRGRTGQDMEFRVQRKDGSVIWVAMSWQPIFDDDGRDLGYRSSVRDITVQHRVTEQLAFEASHDSLTGLLNRRAFETALSRAAEMARAGQGQGGMVLYIDLDLFKLVNDSCGHAAGDELLMRVAQAMQSQAGDGVLARLGGDEFGLYLSGAGPEEATRRGHRLIDQILAVPFSWEGTAYRVGASVGAVELRPGMDTVGDILVAADTACYVAKEKGRGRVQLFSLDDHALSRRRSEVLSLSQIAQALEEHRFVLYHQRIAALSGRHPDHAEILVRLRDTQGRLLAPDSFIPAAERYGMMIYVDRWVVENTFATIRGALDRGVTVPWGRTSINLSGVSLSDDTLCDAIAESLARHRLDPRRFCFEVTETAAMADFDRALTMMDSLRRLGCKLALDDFGVGLSSFAYLKQIKLDYLKIDGLFVKDLEAQPVDRAVVESITHVARVHGLGTIAEYVRSPGVRDIVAAVGVDMAQGFAVHRPEPLADGLAA